MTRQEPKKLSQNDKSYIGKYKTVFTSEIVVIASKDKLGNEYLEWANVVGFAKTPLFEKVEAKEIERKIKAKLITKI
jgi:hypothetical protein